MTKQDSAFLIWGSAGHGLVLLDIIDSMGGYVAAFFDNATVPPIKNDVPIFFGVDGFTDWQDNHAENGKVYKAAVAIGGANGEARLGLIKTFQKAGFETPNLIHTSAVVSPRAHLGVGCQVLALSHLASSVNIGDGCIINSRATVDHECKIGNGVHIGPGATLCGCIEIGHNSFVGAGAVILPRLRIGQNCTIGAGAVVTRDIESGTTVVGNPARQIYPR